MFGAVKNEQLCVRKLVPISGGVYCIERFCEKLIVLN